MSIYARKYGRTANRFNAPRIAMARGPMSTTGITAAYKRRTYARPPTGPMIGTFKTRFNRVGMLSNYGNTYGGETKYIDNGPGANQAAAGTFTDVVIPAAGVIVSWGTLAPGGDVLDCSLNKVLQGTTKNERVGNKFRIHAIRGKLTFFIPAASTIGGDIVRMIIFQDKQCNGVASTVADVLEWANINSFQAMDYVDQIKILFDETHEMNPDTSTVAGKNSIQYFKECHFSLKLNAEIHYNAILAALGGIISNNFNMLLISRNGTTVLAGATGGYPSSSFVRTYFKDQ
nr:MAG: capsid protein [Cressdnaviricota sp.]